MCDANASKQCCYPDWPEELGIPLNQYQLSTSMTQIARHDIVQPELPSKIQDSNHVKRAFQQKPYINNDDFKMLVRSNKYLICIFMLSTFLSFFVEFTTKMCV